MKKIISIFMATIMLLSLVGCSSNKTKEDPVLSEDLTKVVEKIYDTADLDEELRGYLKEYENTKINKSNEEYYLGESDIDFKEGICSAPMMNAIAYELILLRLDENADVEAVKKELKENANPRKWVCVEAEEVVVENVGNVVLFLMGSKEEATPIKDAFLNLANSK
ncbi:YgdI/YgdR family lipoprotein [Intestinibacter bartlettii]|uniref:YgdI/YgdR family lipoprotein n=1 Tax=Intestinibacter bartlettii TaxID=261299 RepID=A0ABS6DTF4_9FIRM|nr:YgdI/YgdR family lipoprotein [Intestinibacter bartlettii]MBU5335121.1 YgdI/YgdR family lipoprotein [Intestinibacter bartlettii]